MIYSTYHDCYITLGYPCYLALTQIHNTDSRNIIHIVYIVLWAPEKTCFSRFTACSCKKVLQKVLFFFHPCRLVAALSSSCVLAFLKHPKQSN